MQGCRTCSTTPGAKRRAEKLQQQPAAEYEISGFVASMGEKRVGAQSAVRPGVPALAGVRDQSAVERSNPVAPSNLSRPRALLDSSPIFSTLRQEEKETFSQNMTLQTFRAGETILEAGEVSDHLFIIESGVVTVTLTRHGTPYRIRAHGPGGGDRRGRYPDRQRAAGPVCRENLLHALSHRKELPEAVPGCPPRHQRCDEILARLPPAQGAIADSRICPWWWRRKAFCNGCAVGCEGHEGAIGLLDFCKIGYLCAPTLGLT